MKPETLSREGHPERVVQVATMESGCQPNPDVGSFPPYADILLRDGAQWLLHKETSG